MAEYIEREALMEYADSQPGGLISNKSIQFFPAADVAPVLHGRWIFVGSTTEGISIYKCSLCGRTTRLCVEDDVLKISPYCHCGAKMDLEDNK